MKVLTDHNNLQGFMKVKALNSRQAQWAIKLTAFNFVISHRLGKMNPTDAPSRRSDYKDINEIMKKLLFTL